MRKTIILAILGVFLFGALGLSVSAWSQDRQSSKKKVKKLPGKIQHLKAIEKEVLRLTNEARRKHHLLALDSDNDLTVTARAHSDDMLKRDFFDHVNPDGASLKDRFPGAQVPAARAGENIYSSSGLDISDVKLAARVMVDGWMASPGHRQNLLNPDYTHLGVGVSSVAAAKQLRATQVFATVKQGK
jgi:uncharacterized protein YkwD